MTDNEIDIIINNISEDNFKQCIIDYLIEHKQEDVYVDRISYQPVRDDQVYIMLSKNKSIVLKIDDIIETDKRLKLFNRLLKIKNIKERIKKSEKFQTF